MSDVPAVTGSGVSTFVTDTSADVVTVVVVVADSLPVFGSAVVDVAVAVLEMVVPVATAGSTATVRVNTALPGVSVPIEHVTVPPLPTAGGVQDHPAG